MNRSIQDILAERRSVIIEREATTCATTRENLGGRIWELDGELEDAKADEDEAAALSEYLDDQDAYDEGRL